MKYGIIAVSTQLTICGAWFGASYVGVKAGIDYKLIADKLGLDPKNETMATASDFAIAYVLYKVMAPIRVPIILATIPVAAKVFRKAPKI